MSMKITTKTRKEELLAYLTPIAMSDNMKASLGELYDRISYTVKKAIEDLKNVSRSDLVSLVKEFDTPTPVQVEAALKPKTDSAEKQTTKRSVKKTSTTDDDKKEKMEKMNEKTAEKKKAKPSAPANEDEPAAKPPLKKKNKDTAKKESGVELIPPVSSSGADIPYAKLFPDEIDHPLQGKLKACKGEYTDYDAFIAAVSDEENPKQLFIVGLWTKRQLKMFNYAAAFNVSVPKEGFPLDLDLLSPVIPCQTMKRVYCMSVLTEAMFTIEPEDLAYIEEADPRSAKGDKFKIRMTNGLEFEIYEKV